MKTIYTTDGEVYRAEDVSIHKGQVFFYNIKTGINDQVSINRVSYIEQDAYLYV